jgi:hypothetical protein
LARLAGFERNASIWVCGTIMSEIAEELASFVRRCFPDIAMKAVDVLYAFFRSG